MRPLLLLACAVAGLAQTREPGRPRTYAQSSARAMKGKAGIIVTKDGRTLVRAPSVKLQSVSSAGGAAAEAGGDDVRGGWQTDGWLGWSSADDTSAVSAAPSIASLLKTLAEITLRGEWRRNRVRRQHDAIAARELELEPEPPEREAKEHVFAHWSCVLVVVLCCALAAVFTKLRVCSHIDISCKLQSVFGTRSRTSQAGKNTHRRTDDAVERLARITECSICFEGYRAEEQKRMPRALPCGHTFCEGCLSSLLAPLVHVHVVGTGRHKPLRCPTCRTVTKVPYGRADGLMANWAVMR